MPDEFINRPDATPERRGGSRLRAVLGTAVLAFLGGAMLVGWLVWSGRITIYSDLFGPHPAIIHRPLPAAPSPASSLTGAEVSALAGFEQRVDALEARLSRIDLKAAAAEGETARAEALLVSFAARRTIERGAPLGYLADQIKMRFADAQPGAVSALIEAGRQPVALDQLLGQLDTLEPLLTQTPAGEGGWNRITHEFSALFTLSRDPGPAPRPASRLVRARQLLRTGQIDAAIREIQALPGAAAAGAWIEAARRYAEAERALDLIETTALLEPAKIGSARPVLTPPPPADQPAAGE